MTRVGIGIALGAALMLLPACDRKGADDGAPVRANDPVPQPRLTSTLSVPIDADPRALRAALERAIPRTLWTIEERVRRCIPPQRIKVFGRNVAVTPTIGCTVVGNVTRGAIRLRGVGRDIYADVPIQARISARDVGGVLKGETATGSALAHAVVRLDIGPDWTPRGTVRFSYDWTTPPGIDFLGQRITFTRKADEKLRPIARSLERSLPRELARLNVRRQVEGLWRRGFTAVKLNDHNPPVWMRITPRQLRYGSYAMNGAALRLDLAIDAVTETFVGDRPADPAPTPLPALQVGGMPPGLRFFIPVVADYRQLEPVVMKALTKRSGRPFDVPGLGPVAARFERATIYGTAGNRIAVGLSLVAWPVAAPAERTRGTVWLAATPANTPGSARVSFRDLTLRGNADRVAGDLLIALGNSPAVVDVIAGALGQNFTDDLRELMGKVRVAIAEKPIDDFVIRARIDRLETGRIAAFGQGLYLPVRASGTARISYRPR